MPKKKKRGAPKHAAKGKKVAKKTAKKTVKKTLKKPVKKAVKSNNLIMFHGTECPHCRNMDPLVARLEKERGVKVEKLEVWHNPKNADILEKIDTGLCGGVPFFWNKKSKRYICGEVDYETLRDWSK